MNDDSKDGKKKSNFVNEINENDQKKNACVQQTTAIQNSPQHRSIGIETSISRQNNGPQYTTHVMSTNNVDNGVQIPENPVRNKWICEYCTYENFPLSLKCTMCRAVKPLLGEDIYRLQDADGSVIDERGGEMELSDSRLNSEPVVLPNDGWPCPICTYINVSKRTICTQCGHIKSRLKQLSSAESINEQVKTLRLSPPSIETVPHASDTLPANANTVQKTQSHPKWVCHICTYENWPKSVKCAMCGNTNPLKSQQPAQILSSQIIEHAAVQDNMSNILDKTPNKISSKHGTNRTHIGINDAYMNSQNNSMHEVESTIRRIKRQRPADWPWLQACLGVVDGDIVPVEQYLANGGDPARALTSSEVSLLSRTSAFDTGHTLVHLAIRFHREEILCSLLGCISGDGNTGGGVGITGGVTGGRSNMTGGGVKRAPQHVAPDAATDVRRRAAAALAAPPPATATHHAATAQDGLKTCVHLEEFTTFSLPSDIKDLPHAVQEQLFDELLDRDAQRQLEEDPPVINWSLELTVHLGSRLYALWNRSAGDCLLDAVMQAQWGVFDKENMLRKALSDCLHQAGRSLYSRWREWECIQAALLSYSLDDAQLLADWSRLVAMAAVPGRSLQQLHVFALAHITRRPIIVYGVNVVNSFRGEAIGYAGFQGVYLPLVWEPEVCSKSPLCLGYTRGHFSALVAMEPFSRNINSDRYICRNKDPDGDDIIFLPLTDYEGKLLPVHFLTYDELGNEENILRRYLTVVSGAEGVMESGAAVGGAVGGEGAPCLLAQQSLGSRPLLVAQMLEEWLNYYRGIAHQELSPFPPKPQMIQHDFSSDGDTDEE